MDPNSTVKELKAQIQRLKPSLHTGRQEIRLEPRGKGLDDGKSVKALGLKDQSKLYLKVHNITPAHAAMY